MSHQWSRLSLANASLLQKDMALDSFGLFIHQSQATEGDLQVKIYQILFDALMLYGVAFLEPRGHGVRECSLLILLRSS